MAMANIAPRSSMIASAVKKIFKPNGTLLPSKAAMPSENAISVAIGIPQPFVYGVPLLIKRKINAGTIMPPIAPIKGSIACEKEDNSPSVISLFISMPTKKKNTAIKPSFIQCKRVCGK